MNVWSNSPVRADVPGVFPDYAQVGRQCAEHLLARGFRNFATLTPPKSYAEETLVREFTAVVEEAGFGCSNGRISQNPEKNVSEWRKAERAIERYFDEWKRPLGVYVGSEGNGRIVAQVCQRRGLRVPQDIAIIAGQNQETLCLHPRPSLTSMEIGYERLGYEAARLLHRFMENEPLPLSSPILIPPIGLCVRESTDFYSVADEQVAAALRFIALNAHRSIGPNEVARAVNAETRTLQNRFGKLLQRPIATEIRRVRLERAKRELTHGRKRLADIARDVGFGNVMRMSSVFGRELGITPGRYRKQMSLPNGE